MDEFGLIEQFLAHATGRGEDVVLGIGDDAAIVNLPASRQLAICTDTLVAGRHFLSATAPADIGWKALAVNLSDLAAMGAEPRWFTLALTLPEADSAWLEAFARGLGQLAAQTGTSLVGGDTTRGPLAITITAGGWLEPGCAIRRAGAKPGDVLCVTGSLGDAALALKRAQEAADARSSESAAWLRQRLDRPSPRIEAGRALAGLAHAAIDISDGLLADAGHLRLDGGQPGGIVIDTRALPRSDAFRALAPAEIATELQLTGGDDYELCLSLAPEDVAEAQHRLADIALSLTVVGEVLAQPGLWLKDADDCHACDETRQHGFNHFLQKTEGKGDGG